MLSASLPGEARPTAAYTVDERVPARAVRPADIPAATRAVAEAHEAGEAVIPWGGGTHQALGNLPTRYDLALDLGELAGIVDHQPADLTLTVLAGTPLAEVHAALARHGQFLPLEAEDPARATVGGLLSARVAGPLRAGYGTARDFTLWVEAIAPDGRLVHGGAKVVKNVAGYDLTKLYQGSLGSAGVLTQVCFKVLPAPERQPTIMLAFEEAGAAADALAELATGRLAPSLVTMVRGPARWGEPYAVGPWVLVVGADGPAATAAWQLERFYALANAAGATEATAVYGDESLAVRQALMTYRAEGAVRLAMMVLPGQVPLVLEQLQYLPGGAPLGVFAEANNGVVRATWSSVADAAEAHPWLDAAGLAADLGGRWVLEAAPAAWKRAGLDVWGPAGGDRPLMRRLKQALDSKGILVPGRFTGG